MKKKSDSFLPITWHRSAPKFCLCQKTDDKTSEKKKWFHRFCFSNKCFWNMILWRFWSLDWLSATRLNPSPSSLATGAPRLSYRDQLGWKSINITLLSDSWQFSVTLIKVLSDISKLSYIRDTFVPWIKEYYDEGYGKDVVLGCLTDFWQRFLAVWPAICKPSSILAQYPTNRWRPAQVERGSISPCFKFLQTVKFCNATNGFPAKWRLRNERRKSILMTCHYPDLGSASD